MIAGCITALVTPFRNGRLDIAGLRRNVKFQLKHRVSGVLVGGSTGEAPALTEKEREKAITTVVSEVRGRIPVMVGAGTNSTAKSIRVVRQAKQLGADAVLVVAPYYVKPTQEGLYRHFRTIAEAVDIPIVVYNIPGRCSVNIEPATIEKMVRNCPGIIGVKEASGRLDQASEIIQRCGDRVSVLSGDDSLTLPILSVGGKGVVSVVSNLVPEDVVLLIEYYLGGKINPAAKLHCRLYPLIKALFVETNPIPVKAAMEMVGMAAGEPRLPLVPLSKNGRRVVRKRLKEYGLNIVRRDI